jgi:hypothetical protein
MAIFIVSSIHWRMAGGTSVRAKLACAGRKMGVAGESLNGLTRKGHLFSVAMRTSTARFARRVRLCF